MEEDVTFELRTEYITLDALLKAAALVSSGGAAKQMIQDGQVLVDGHVETRRGRKLRPGQTVQSGRTRVRLQAGPGSPQDERP